MYHEKKYKEKFTWGLAREIVTPAKGTSHVIVRKQ